MPSLIPLPAARDASRPRPMIVRVVAGRLLALVALAAVALAAGVLAAGVWAADQAARPAGGAAPVVIPMDILDSGHFAVEVMVQDKGPFELLLDTGSPVVLVTEKLAGQLGVAGKGESSATAGVLGTGTQVHLKSIRVGKLVATDVPALVMDHPALAALSDEGRSIEGVLGLGFLSRYTVTLDYQARTVTLAPSGPGLPDLLATLPDSWTAMVGDGESRRQIVAPRGLWGLRLAKEPSSTAAGVSVAAVAHGSAAWDAGIRVGDVLLTIDGRFTDTIADGYHAAACVDALAAVEVSLERAGRRCRATVRPRQGL